MASYPSKYRFYVKAKMIKNSDQIVVGPLHSPDAADKAAVAMAGRHDVHPHVWVDAYTESDEESFCWVDTYTKDEAALRWDAK